MAVQAVRRLVDLVLMRDVGLVKTQLALRTLLCVPAGMGAGYLVAVHVGLPGILGLLIGAMPAFISCLVIADPSAWRTSGRTGALVVPFVLALFTSISLHEFRVLELVLIVGLLFIQFAAAGWGTWLNDFAVMLFAGYLCGLLSPLPETSILGLGLIGAASLVVTIVIRALLFRPAPYRSLLRTRRAFVVWSGVVLADAVTALRVPDDDVRARDRAVRRLRRRLVRLQEVALTADGMLANAGADHDGQRAEHLHRLLFDTQLAVDGLGRSAVFLATGGAPARVRLQVADAYAAVIARGGVHGEDAARELLARFGATPFGAAPDPGSGGAGAGGAAVDSGDAGSRVPHVVHRIVLHLADLTSAGTRWRALRDDLPRSGAGVPFRTPVVLVAGRPAGAVPLLDEALENRAMSGPWRRVHVSAAIRTGFQAAIAVAIVEPIALLISGQRFYWGVIGVMIVLAGTNTTHDRIRKGIQRGIGTVVGGLIGIPLVALLGTTHPAATIVLVSFSLAIGMYGFGGVYSVWTAALVVVLCQVYAYSGTFSDALVPLRLVENLLGAAVAILVSAFLFPVATGTMIRNAERRQLAAVRAFVLEAGGVPSAPGSSAPGSSAPVSSAPRSSAPVSSAPGSSAPVSEVTGLRTRSRALDAATYQLDAVMKPMVRFPTGGGDRSDAMTRTTLQAVAIAARELAGRPGPASPVSDALARGLADAAVVLASSIDALSGRIGVRHVDQAPPADAHAGEKWVRASDMLDDIDEAARGTTDAPDPALEWLHERVQVLARIDDALAMLAERAGLPVVGTASASTAPTERARRAAALVARRFAAPAD